MTIADLRLVATLASNPRMSGCLSWSRDGRFLATGHYLSARIWDAASSECVAQLPHPDVVRAVAWHPSSERLVTGCADLNVRIWDVERAVNTTTFRHEGEATGVEWAGEGSFFAVMSGTRKVHVWGTVFRDLKWSVNVHPGHVASIAWDGLGHNLAVCSDRRVRIWNPWTRTQVAVLTHLDKVADASWSPDRKCMAVVDRTGVVRLWDLAAGTRIDSMDAGSKTNTRVAWNPVSESLVVGGIDGRLSLWDTATRSRLWTAIGHRGRVGAIVWSPGGNRFASCGVDEDVRIWDAAPGTIGLVGFGDRADIGLMGDDDA